MDFHRSGTTWRKEDMAAKIAHKPPAKLFGGDALGAYAMAAVESVAGMLQSGSISVLWSLAELQDAFAVTGDVAEIGVHHGRLFIMLCLALNPGERAHAVDISAIRRAATRPTGTSSWPTWRAFILRPSISISPSRTAAR